jgi:hypothetical protein
MDWSGRGKIIIQNFGGTNLLNDWNEGLVTSYGLIRGHCLLVLTPCATKRDILGDNTV